MNKSYFFKFLLSISLSLPLVGFTASETWTIEDVLEASSHLSEQIRDQAASAQKPPPRAYAAVSLSMPQASLERLARDAKDAGIPLVFRGVPPSAVFRLPTVRAMLNCRCLILSRLRPFSP